MAFSVTIFIDSKALTAQLDGLAVLLLLYENEGDAAETAGPNTESMPSKIELRWKKG